MAVVRLWHCRDRLNGGRLDGAAYVNANGGYSATCAQVPVKCRVRFDDFATGATRAALWGVGAADGADGYMLLIEKSAGAYRPVVRWLNTEVVFGDIVLYAGTLYDIRTRGAAGVAYVEVHDRYGRLLWSAEETVTATGTLSTANLYIGATNAAGTPQLPLVGTLFDFWCAINGTDYVRLVFYKGYNGVGSGTVADAFGNRHATVVNAPDDFWPARTDISNYVTALDKLRRETDSHGAPTFTTCTFTCCDVFGAQPGDVMEVESVKTSGVNWLYTVTSVEELSDNRIKLHCAELLTELNDVPASAFFSVTAAFTTARNDWWSNYAPVFFGGNNYSLVEYYYDASNELRRWASLGFVLQNLLCFLQLDNILSCSLTGLLDESSPLQYGGSALAYRWFAFNLHEMRYAGRGCRDANAGASMGVLLRQMALALRFGWLLEDGVLRFLPLDSGLVSLTDNQLLEYSRTLADVHEPHQIRQQRLPSGVNAWDAWTETGEQTYNNLTDSYCAQNDVEDVTLASVYQIRRHDNAGNALLALSPDPLAQLADILDAAYCGPREAQTLRTAFLPQHNTRYRSKTDDTVNMTSDVYLEA